MQHFNWTWEYLHWNIAYSKVQKMLIDASNFDYDKPSANSSPKPQTQKSYNNLINNLLNEQ